MQQETPAPASLSDLQAILGAELAASLQRSAFSSALNCGCVIGLLQNGARLVFTLGNTAADGLYEIGSITKTFTGLLLSRLVQEQILRLDTPIRQLLPANLIKTPASDHEITLLDLSIHRSGLPRLPDNFGRLNPRDPYANYDKKKLYAFIRQHGVAKSANTSFLYSNLGTGLLGQLLSDAAGTSYEQLLREKITGPLGMNETHITLPPSMQARLVQGLDAKLRLAPPWHMDSLAAAGGLRSTVNDMLLYLEAQLHPDQRLAADANKTLRASIVTSQTPYRDAMPGMHIALNWFCVDRTETRWHNGGTGGFSSFACFNRKNNHAAVILCNVADTAFTDALGWHIARKLLGEPSPWTGTFPGTSF